MRVRREALARQAEEAPAAPAGSALQALASGMGNAAFTSLVTGRHPAAAGRAAVMRFDASKHEAQGIRAAGMDPETRLGRPEHHHKPGPREGSKEYGVSAVYAGNFMQDFSQIHSPLFHRILSEVPKDPVEAATGGKSEQVGAAGGKTLADALIRALAIIHLGPKLADDLVVTNMQNWLPEQHVEQPVGYAKADALDAADPAKLEGAAVPGPQMENPRLREVSDAGLQRHIYNSTEWTKRHLLVAASAGATDQGRFRLGAAHHAIQDYYAHSNFIEVALNCYIDWAEQMQRRDRRRRTRLGGVGRFLDQVKADKRDRGKPQSLQSRSGRPGGPRSHVDTLYDEYTTPPKGGGAPRQAITTGSFGGTDLRASLAHMLLPVLPELTQAIDQGIERLFGLVADDGLSTFDEIVVAVQDHRPSRALLALGDGLDQAGVVLPTPMFGVMMVPGPVPFPVPYLLWPNRPFMRAIAGYVGVPQRLRDLREQAMTALDAGRAVAGGLLQFIPSPFTQLQEDIRAQIDVKIEEAKKEYQAKLQPLQGQAKATINNLIVDALDKLSGFDSRGTKARTIEQAAETLHESVEDIEHQTSIEARLLPPGDLSTKPQAEVEAIVGPVTKLAGGGYAAHAALPPSHSEIAKDHAPSEELHGGDDEDVDAAADAVKRAPGEPLYPDIERREVERKHGSGSLFFGLADALAVETTKQISHAMEDVWLAKDPKSSIYGDNRRMGPSPDRLAEWEEQVRHKDFAGEAGRVAEADSRRLPKDQHHAQSSPYMQDQLAKQPEVRRMLDMVDLIFSHPSDSKWWKTIFDSYVNANAEEVADHIVHRNATRGLRQRAVK